MTTRRLWIRGFGIAVGALLFGVLAWQASMRLTDFQVYYGVGTRILQGDFSFYPTDYSVPVSGHEFRYAPVIGFLFVPLALLSQPAAAFAFFLLKLAALWYVCAILSRRLSLGDRSLRCLVIGMLLVAGYLAEELTSGNFQMLMVALFVLAFDRAERGQVAAPAAALAVAIATKITPIILLGYFVLKRRLAVAAATVAMLAVLWALPAVAIGVQANNQLFRDWARYAVQKIGEEGNHSLRGALIRHVTENPGRNSKYPDTSVASLSEPAVNTLWVALVFAGAGLSAFAVTLRNTHDAERGSVELSLLLTAILLASPHTQRIYFSSLFVPATVLVALLVKYPKIALGGLMRMTLAATAVASTILPALVGSRRLALAYEALSPYVWATLMMFATLVVLAIRSRHAPLSGDPAQKDAPYK
jgi:hypothetical protein